MSDSILQVNQIKDKGGNATGITVADTTANVTVGNLTATTAAINAGSIASAVAFPAGHIIKSGLLIYHVNGSTAISTSNTSFVDTGLAATLTTLKASSDSRLEFYLFSGTQQYQLSNLGEVTLTLTAASNTSYVSQNDILYSPAAKNQTGEVGGTSTLNQTNMYCYHYNSSQTNPNAYPQYLSQYSAGDTLHVRVFIRRSGSNSFFFYTTDSHLTLHYYEIEK